MTSCLNNFYINSLAEVQIPEPLRKYEDIENDIWSLTSENFNDVMAKCKSFITNFNTYSYTLNILASIINIYPDELKYQNLFELLLKDFTKSGYRYIPIDYHIMQFLTERKLIYYCNDILRKKEKYKRALDLASESYKLSKFREQSFLSEEQIKEYFANPNFDVKSYTAEKAFVSTIYWKNIERFNLMLEKQFQLTCLLIEYVIHWGTMEMIQRVLKRMPSTVTDAFSYAVRYHRNDVADFILQKYKIDESLLNKTNVKSNLRGMLFLLLNGLINDSKLSFVKQFAVANFVDGFKYLRQFHLDYEKTNIIGLSILFDSYDTFKFLIDMKVRCYESSPSAIFAALNSDNIKYLINLISTNYITNTKGLEYKWFNCESFIQLAIKKNLYEHAKLLIRNTNVKNIDRFAINESFKSLDFVKLIDEKGCKIDSMDALFHKLQPNSEVLRYLIHKGVKLTNANDIQKAFNIFCKENDRKTLEKISEVYPSFVCWIRSVENSSLELIQWLINKNFTFTEETLISAVKSEDIEKIKLLKTKVQSFSTKYIKAAFQTCNVDVINFVISEAKDLKSLLIHSLSRKNQHCIGFKIVFSKCKKEIHSKVDTPKLFERALEKSCVDAAFILLDNYSCIIDKPGIIQKACLTGSFELVEALINRDFKAIDATLPHPVNIAVKFGNLKMIKLLLENGFSVDGYNKTDTMKPLYLAISQRMYEIASFLLANNASQFDYKQYFSETELSSLS